MNVRKLVGTGNPFWLSEGRGGKGHSFLKSLRHCECFLRGESMGGPAEQGNIEEKVFHQSAYFFAKILIDALSVKNESHLIPFILFFMNF